MELILLSVFGIALLFVLELCGLFYERWVSEPHLTGSDLRAAPSAKQPDSTATMRANVSIERALHCSDAANDADVTTIRRVMPRDGHRESTGE